MTTTTLRCFYCDRVSAQENNFRLTRAGLLTCVDCAQHDARSAQPDCTCGSFYFTGCLCGITVDQFRAGRVRDGRAYDLR